MSGLKDMATRCPAVDRADVDRRLKEVRSELERLGVRSLRLFGSAARDELQPDSDVDILVEFAGSTRFRAFMATRRLLEQALGRRVDLVTPGALKPSLAARIARDVVDATCFVADACTTARMETVVRRLGEVSGRS